jgi:hypothetical protein
MGEQKRKGKPFILTAEPRRFVCRLRRPMGLRRKMDAFREAQLTFGSAVYFRLYRGRSFFMPEADE